MAKGKGNTEKKCEQAIYRGGNENLTELKRISQRKSNLVIYSLDWQKLKRPVTPCAQENTGE